MDMWRNRTETQKGILKMIDYLKKIGFYYGIKRGNEIQKNKCKNF
jgi:hypothetical protein